MLISTVTDMVWNARIKKHYVDAGYKYTKMKDKFIVKVDDLTAGSNAKVSVQCDYCGTIYEIEYYRYLTAHNGEIKTDCCDKCKKNKIKDVLMKKYGVIAPNQVEGAQDKIRQTNLRLYGAENPFSSESVKEKISETNLKKYGFRCANRSEIVQAKRRQTCIERYGADSHMKLEKYRKMVTGENSVRWKPDKDSESRERDRSCLEYRFWRNKVFQRDHYRCRCCGGRGDGKHGLEAHHIANYSSNPEIRFSLENGITLCYYCHKRFHSTYGKKNNNLSQLISFLNQGKKVC